MGLNSAVNWWEESQLRVLVLSSLIIQWLLLLSSAGRRFAVPGWFRSIIWLAYLGSDAVAIYGLATLFNRHKNQDRGGSSILEVVWAPVLLIHLGGQDGITAYNLEDNELWTRHVLTAVSQVTVAIYVFSKSWPPGSDKKLLQAAILLFVVGVLKCLEKPLALKNASINSLVSSAELAQKTTNRDAEIQDFVREAKAFVLEQMEGKVRGVSVQDSDPPDKVQHEGERSSVQGSDHPEAQEEDQTVGWWRRLLPITFVKGAKAVSPPVNDEEGVPLKLFVDLTHPYPKRFAILKSFWSRNRETLFQLLQDEIANVFTLLYTKSKMFPPEYYEAFYPSDTVYRKTPLKKPLSKFVVQSFQTPIILVGTAVRGSRYYLPWAAIGLFHRSHRESYEDTDVKITYALLCCTAVLELYTMVVANRQRWPCIVSQYDLIGFFIRNKNQTLCISFKYYIEQHWWIKSCNSSCMITGLVFQYVKSGWEKHIYDAASYLMFNDHKGQRTLELQKCKHLDWSLNRPFDESVLLWHIAADLCFYTSAYSEHKCSSDRVRRNTSPSSQQSSEGSLRDRRTSLRCEDSVACKAVLCQQMSNYMMYLLFVNPEMLLPGSRRNLFKTSYIELKDILEPLKTERGSTQRQTFCEKLCQWPKRKRLCRRFEETELVQQLNYVMESTGDRNADDSKEKNCKQGGFIHEAWDLAQGLLSLDDEKRWEVIQGIWVEMLCYSAGRCRGYLHAKALGTGGELLTYVWLLLSNMGMETFAEKLQRPELPSEGRNAAAAPSTSEFPIGGAAPWTSEDHTSAAPSTSETTTADLSTSKALFHDAASSTSEIHAGDDMV